MMDTCLQSGMSRRSLLASTAALLVTGTTAVRARTITQGLPWEPGAATPPVPVRPGPWRFFTVDEAVLVEAAVDRLIPPDDRGPGGKDAGCAVFIDRQLAGPEAEQVDQRWRHGVTRAVERLNRHHAPGVENVSGADDAQRA